VALAAAVANLWSVARKIEELFNLHTKVDASLKVIDERLRALEDRLLKLETGQSQLVTEARTAASAASTAMTSAVIGDTITRVTRLEGRADQLEQQRLPPP
jgi:hypothetical protein